MMQYAVRARRGPEGLQREWLRRKTMSESWHNLLAAIPKEARINRRPVIAPGSLRSIDGAPVADWETLTIELSDGNTGLRHVLVTLDGLGRAISASDLVLYRHGR